LGKSQAKKVASRLKNEEIDLIYSSDLKRAKETAKEINKFHNLDIKYDKRIRELAKGEEIESLVQRVKLFFEEIKTKKKNILVVAHGGTNLTIIAISTGDKEKGGKIVKRYRQSNNCVKLVEK
jgi:broad specificity phosphatase PhoE